MLNHTETDIQILSVSRLNQLAKDMLKNQFGTVWIEGEVSNFAAPQSGHWYFSLKDEKSQIRCALFNAKSRHWDFCMKDGLHVLARASVSLYEPRGDYQLIVESLEERGEGKLQRAFEQLKKKLQALGWFADSHKKTFPKFPKQIGIITSSTGAAIRDILIVLNRRFPAIPVLIYPCLVQGPQAAPNIAAAIEKANQRKECDVLIVARGGGSLEDLWAFNEEIVASAIYQSQLPIMSAIGHEIDFTIADFVSDLRAPTPSVAAELMVPHQADLLSQLNQYQKRLQRGIQQFLTQKRQALAWQGKQLQQHHPLQSLQEKMQTLDLYRTQLSYQMNQRLTQEKNQLSLYAQAINQCNPLTLLARGYQLTYQNQTQRLMQRAQQLKTDDAITIQFADGKVEACVTRVSLEAIDEKNKSI